MTHSDNNTPQLIDTHCHFAHKQLHGNIASLLESAAELGVNRVIAAAGNLEESRFNCELARKFSHVYALAGIHPHESKDSPTDLKAELGELADGCVGIGEIGLDYHYDFSQREIQREVFARQLEAACDFSLPVVVHSREAFGDTMAILRESTIDPSCVLFHSFAQGQQEAVTALDYGAKLSFSGMATFKNAADVLAAARITPLDRIMLETDAPYLSPVPVRNVKPNVPAHVYHVAVYLAAARAETLARLAAATTAIATAFFGLV